MNCPTCTITPLVLAQRQGIEIDYCPHCRGVWLDRGELDKLVERAAEGAPPPREPSHRGGSLRLMRRPRRSSWLGDIFD